MNKAIPISGSSSTLEHVLHSSFLVNILVMQPNVKPAPWDCRLSPFLWCQHPMKTPFQVWAASFPIQIPANDLGRLSKPLGPCTQVGDPQEAPDLRQARLWPMWPLWLLVE